MINTLYVEYSLDNSKQDRVFLYSTHDRSLAISTCYQMVSAFDSSKVFSIDHSDHFTMTTT